MEAAWAGTNEDDIIDSDQLLDEDDLKKPDEKALRGKIRILPFKL